MQLLPPAAVGLGAAALTVLALWVRGRRAARARLAQARAEAAVAVRGAKLEATAARRAAQTRAREEALELRAATDHEISERVEELARREERVAALEVEVAGEHEELDRRWDRIDDRQNGIRSLKDRARGLEKNAAAIDGERVDKLEKLAGETREQVSERLIKGWLDEARSEAAYIVRSVEQSSGDPEFGRRAQRLMEVAVSRYRNHFLTERSISNLPVQPEVAELLTAGDARLLSSLQEVANVTLKMSESGDSVRLEGLDGVGREVARRALSRLHKKPQSRPEAEADPVAWAGKIREQLDREIQGLGKKAFSVLKIPKAHPEIISLVGRLNYRTSYTQNQWLHAVEASFLAGMMADELGLDVKLARRATLLHDIGKALTHEIEGSHAVIGADIARRLGELELVANAIGAHHADEPPGSVYAFLVAGADAMSGARPGARREHTDGYSTRLEDLERIGSSYEGVERCYAVHGGRELRVYVREGEVSDLDAVELSSEIADHISEEMTFPGQIKVTVIRATEAVASAR